MPVHQLDAVGLKCPQPVLKLAEVAITMETGDILEVSGDCPTFEKDVRTWCQRLGKVFLSVNNHGDLEKKIQIQF